MRIVRPLCSLLKLACVDAGIAYINVFGLSVYQQFSPALVFYNRLGSRADFTAEAASHEVRSLTEIGGVVALKCKLTCVFYGRWGTTWV